ncbi:MAG: S8 family serine peptidase [Arenimonas sp.]
MTVRGMSWCLPIFAVLLAALVSAAPAHAQARAGKPAPTVRWVAGEVLVQVDPALELRGNATGGEHVDLAGARFHGGQASGLAALNRKFGVTDAVFVLPRYQPSSMAARRESPGARAAKTRASMASLGRWVRIKVQAGADIQAIARAYAALDEIIAAEPNYVFDLTDATPDGNQRDLGIARSDPPRVSPATFTPNDPSFASQWGLIFVNADDAWSITQGSAATVIAIIDTGIDLDHPDLASKIWINPFEAAGDSNADGCPGRCGIDDDGDGLIDEDNAVLQQGQPGFNAAYIADDDENGYIDDFKGWNWIGTGQGQDNNDPQDDQGHGTHVAGIAAAATSNGIGIAGACPDCTLMPLKAFGAAGTASTTDIVKAVDYAWRNGAAVINMSFGSYADSAILNSALGLAFSRATLVAAAGNDARSRGTSPFYPAHYSFVLGVEALKTGGGRASFSNYGYVTSAPGADILSTLFDDTYASWSGTSMAAPMTAGLAGLVRSLHAGDPAWGPDLVFGQMVQSGGDALQAVSLSPAPELNYVEHHVVDTVGSCPTCDGDGVADAGETVNLVVTVRNLWGNATAVNGTLASTNALAVMTDGNATWGGIGPAAFDDNADNPFRIQVSAATGNNFDIAFNLAVAAGNGGTGIAQQIVLRIQRGIEKGGVLAADETWTANNLYLVTQNLSISPGVTLTIQAGTRVQVSTGKGIVVQGTLVARGTPSARIIFTGNPDSWNGIIFAQGSTPVTVDGAGNWVSGTVLDYCIVEKIRTGEGLVLHSSPMLRKTIFRDNVPRSYFVAIDGDAHPIIEKNLFTSIAATLMSDTRHAAKIEHNTIVGNTSDGATWTYGVGPQPFSANNLFGNSPYSYAVMSNQNVSVPGNYWGTTSPAAIADAIFDFYDFSGFGFVDYAPPLSAPDPLAPPVVANIALAPASPVGVERVTFTVTFSHAMNTAIVPVVFFGPADPFTSHAATLNPTWVNPTTFTVQADITVFTGDGLQTLLVANALDPEGFPLPDGDHRFGFEIVTTGTSSDALQASASAGRIDLSWPAAAQPDIAGYNVYRADAETGPFAKRNPALVTGHAYVDLSVAPGVTYYYTYRVVNTQAQEGPDSNIASATAPDNIAPVIVHTPVTSAPAGQSITLVANITDNIATPTASLYYRKLGSAAAWTPKSMTNATGSQFTANIPATAADGPGVDYYIEATDGTNITRHGTAVAPHPITIAVPSLSVGDASITEGDSGTKTLTFTITLSQPSAVAVTFNVNTGASGSATPGSDFVAVPTVSRSIAAGLTSKAFAVTINGDTAAEPDESFSLDVSSVAYATVVDAQGIGTILNDDGQPSPPNLSINNSSVTEGNSGTKLLTFTASLSQAASSTVTFNANTQSVTAATGSDFVGFGGPQPFSIPAGQLSKTVDVTINGDTTIEQNETFNVNLSSVVGATLVDGQGVGTITNDDSTVPGLRINDVSIVEGNSGTKVLAFTATLTAASANAVTFNAATQSDTAAVGSDFVGFPATGFNIPAGQLTTSVNVTINGDTTIEGNETFNVNLSSVAGATLLDGQGVGTITNDDTSTPTLAINDATLIEGNVGTRVMTFTVSLSQAAATTVTFNAATQSGTATVGSDFVGFAPTAFSIPAGQLAKAVVVTLNSDTVIEETETFKVNLSSVNGATLVDGQGIGTITNDDVNGLKINNVSISEGNAGTKVLSFTASLNQALGNAVTFNAATQSATATVGSDFVGFTPTGYNIPAGQLTATVNVTINGDATIEANETLNVNLSSVVGTTLLDGQGVGTITNDD